MSDINGAIRTGHPQSKARTKQRGATRKMKKTAKRQRRS